MQKSKKEGRKLQKTIKKSYAKGMMGNLGGGKPKRSGEKRNGTNTLPDGHPMSSVEDRKGGN